MNYQVFKAEWLGRRVDYDHVYAYQCVDLILEYVKECYGLASGVWGNAIDYWNHPSPVLLTKFDKVSTTQTQQGDIVVLNGLPGNPYGHIGIADHQDSSGVWILEQNATGDGTGTGRGAIGVYRAIPLPRIAGVLRPKANPTPAPTPAPARQTVYLPPDNQYWHLYRIGSLYRPNTTDVIATLAPAYFGGLTYKVEGWIGTNYVIITTQYYGRGVIYVGKDTDAKIL